MPNRILRDWTDSEKINELSVHAERFFTRLIMKVDDYGRFTANVKMLKPMLFPLLIDQIREADLSRWMTECQKAGLVVIYEVNLKQVLQICNFKQALRQKIEKYPPPEALKGNATQMHSRCIADASLKPEEKPETRNRNPESGNRNPEEVFLEKKIINPFSEKFISQWQRWIDYKKKQHKFKYADLEYEQQAVDALVDISQNNENNAVEIINSAIANGYKGLFPLDKNSKNQNSKQTTHESIAKNQGRGFFGN